MYMINIRLLAAIYAGLEIAGMPIDIWQVKFMNWQVKTILNCQVNPFAAASCFIRLDLLVSLKFDKSLNGGIHISLGHRVNIK